MMPGDPARLIAGEQATTEDVERIRVAYGYDKPLYVQYFKYVGVSFREFRHIYKNWPACGGRTGSTLSQYFIGSHIYHCGNHRRRGHWPAVSCETVFHMG